MKIQKPDTNFRYSWLQDGKPLNGETSAELNTDNSGRIQAVKWNTSGYRDTSDAVKVSRLPLPPKPFLTRQKQVLDAGNGYDSYQWFLNDTLIQGETGKTHFMQFTGYYSCRVGDKSGCFNYSDTLQISDLAIRQNLHEHNILIKPNPTVNEAYININRSGISTVKLYDVNGKVLYELKGLNMKDMPCGLMDLSAGMYTLSVENEGSRFFFRILKH
ncbi:MAG: T9SS type A sorting domain-containing protein [Flavobacteriales bacterium]|nr:T9SS type A sorting domain-containing protein [Flavobacteriales bacterium]